MKSRIKEINTTEKLSKIKVGKEDQILQMGSHYDLFPRGFRKVAILHCTESRELRRWNSECKLVKKLSNVKRVGWARGKL